MSEDIDDNHRRNPERSVLEAHPIPQSSVDMIFMYMHTGSHLKTTLLDLTSHLASSL